MWEDKSNKIKSDIIKLLDEINDTDKLDDIREHVRDLMPMTLKQYIQSELGNRPDTIIDAYYNEIIELLEKMQQYKIEATASYIDHFTEIYIQGHALDIWIQEECPLFNAWNLSNTIFKIYCGEIIIEECHNGKILNKNYFKRLNVN